MRGLRFLGLLAALLVALSGCAGRTDAGRSFSYLNGPVQLALTGRVDGMQVQALLQSKGREEGDAPVAVPDFTLTYLAPDALAGVRVSYRSDGTYEVSLGELQAQGEAFEALGRIGFLLLRESAVSSRTPRTWQGPDGQTREAVVLQTVDGATRWHDAKTGGPLALSCTADGHAIELTVIPGEGQE